MMVCNASMDSFKTMPEKIAESSYSSFFPLSAAAYLCICDYWLRLISAIDAAPDRPKLKSPLCLVSLLFVTELLRDLGCMLDMPPSVSGLYFVWMALVSTLVALNGIRVAR